MLTIFLPKLMFFSAIVEQIYLVNMTLKEQGHCLSKLAISNISICIIFKKVEKIPAFSQWLCRYTCHSGRQETGLMYIVPQ